ncbi:DUF6779 domain-containing protein [Nocardia sp. X0981]
MVSPSRSSTSTRGREDVGRLFLGASVLLGVVASVFLVLSDSLQFIRVGLVIALWAAVLGAWAVNRYQAKVRDMRRVYESELEREINARREHEFGVEARVRSEVGAEATEMAALRTELAALRRQLERLFDGELPEERPALRASAFRVQELPSGQEGPGLATGWPVPEEGDRGAVDAWANAAAGWSHAADGWVDTDSGASRPGSDGGERNAVTPIYETDHPNRPRFASPDDAPVTAETAIVRLDDDPPRSPVAPHITGPTWSDAFTEVHDDPADSAARDERYGPPHPAEFLAGPPRPPEQLHGPPAPEPTAATPEPGTGTTEAAPAKSRQYPGGIQAALPRKPSRRRRVHTDTGGARRLSVAEIMANLRQEEEQRSS